MFDWK